MTEVEAQKIVTVMTASFPSMWTLLSKEDQRETMKAYRSMFRDLDYAVTDAAVRRLLATARKMPSIAEVREAVGVVVHGVTKSGGEAWGEVMRAIRTKGSHRTPGVDFEFEDPITARVVSALGWFDLCASDQTGHIADRARFIETYENIQRTERREAQVLPGATSPRLPELEARVAKAQVVSLVGGVARKLSAKPESTVICACGHNLALHFKAGDECSRCGCTTFAEAR